MAPKNRSISFGILFLTLTEYAVISAGLEKDRQVIIDLWRQNLVDIDQLEEKYDWHFLNNPFGLGQIWILTADGHPVGTASLAMRPLRVGDTVTTAGMAGDLAVNKDHRFLQPALTLQRALMSSAHGGIRMLYGVPNPGAASVMKYVGYREFCPIHRYAKALKMSHYLQRSGKLGAVAPFIGKIADQGLAAWQSIGRRQGKRGTQVLHSFDERFDELWSGLGSSQTTLTIRDRKFLQWRYRDCPLRQYKTIGLLTDDDSRLLGYLIYYVEANSAVCADLLALGGAENLDCLLSFWAAQASGDGLASLSVSCSDQALASSLVRHGFSQRSIVSASKPGRASQQERSKTLFTYDRHAASEPTIATNWYYTDGDSLY
jgi:hypothetical protein